MSFSNSIFQIQVHFLLILNKCFAFRLKFTLQVSYFCLFFYEWSLIVTFLLSYSYYGFVFFYINNYLENNESLFSKPKRRFYFILLFRKYQLTNHMLIANFHYFRVNLLLTLLSNIFSFTTLSIHFTPLIRNSNICKIHFYFFCVFFYLKIILNFSYEIYYIHSTILLDNFKQILNRK